MIVVWHVYHPIFNWQTWLVSRLLFSALFTLLAQWWFWSYFRFVYHRSTFLNLFTLSFAHVNNEEMERLKWCGFLLIIYPLGCVKSDWLFILKQDVEPDLLDFLSVWRSKLCPEDCMKKILWWLLYHSSVHLREKRLRCCSMYGISLMFSWVDNEGYGK